MTPKPESALNIQPLGPVGSAQLEDATEKKKHGKKKKKHRTKEEKERRKKEKKQRKKKEKKDKKDKKKKRKDSKSQENAFSGNQPSQHGKKDPAGLKVLFSLFTF
jgi:hypothetical protein